MIKDAKDLKNPVLLLQDLVQCRSITPEDDGAQELLKNWLSMLGFTIHSEQFGKVKNLYARRAGKKPGKNLLLAGHSDVVPVSDIELWQYPPFAGEIANGLLYGRGAQDMKGALACFIAAVARIDFAEYEGTISCLITGDEEGPALHGTVQMLEHMYNLGERWDGALVGEPTCKQQLGDCLKVGRRGSINAVLKVIGKAGHVAYPERASNAAKNLSPFLEKLANMYFDDSSEHFQKTNLEITKLEAGDGATNVIPAEAQLAFNIRFNDNWNIDQIKYYVESQIQKVSGEQKYDLHWLDGASESFLCPDSGLIANIVDACQTILKVVPKLDTNGGTSDARFIKKYCPVLEFGLCGDLMHQCNESVPIEDLEALTNIYAKFIKNFANFT